MKRYFDYNATTPTDPRVMEAMNPYFFERFHNPSSFYRQAGEASAAIDAARQQVAGLIRADADEIIFTSGGTESDNLAIWGVVNQYKSKGNHIITTAIEHPAVLNAAKELAKNGFEVTFLPVDRVGMINPDDLKAAIKDSTLMVTIMHANNEIGTIQPIRELAALARQKGVLFHTDAVQSTGKLPLNVRELGIDFLTFSSHKIYGPKGMGVLYIKKKTKIKPLIWGGGHERGIRAGTENVPGIVGLGKAAEIIATEGVAEEQKLRPIRDWLQQEIIQRIPEVLINGDTDQRLYNTLNVSIKFIEGESMLAFLDQEGFALSSGSACSSKSLDPSHVLLAIGLKHEDAHGSLRISLGKYNTWDDAKDLMNALPPIVERLRQISPFWQKR